MKLSLLAGLGLAACASVGVTHVKQAPARAADCPLDVYTSETEITRPYEVLCLLDARSGSTAFSDKTVAGAVNAARPDACGCGAEAILIVGGSTEGMSAFKWGEGTAMLKALRYTGAAAEAPTQVTPFGGTPK